MAYIPDGSKIDYMSNLPRKNLYAWGWIGNKVPLSVHHLPDAERTKLINKIKSIDEKHIVEYCMGHHICEICGKNDFNFNGSIKILYKTTLYVAPAGVHHYIEFHGYTPPRIVLKALEEGIILTEEELDTFNKNDEQYQKDLNKRAAAYMREQEVERIKDERIEAKHKRMAQDKLDRINKHMNSGDAFARRLKELFLMDSVYSDKK